MTGKYLFILILISTVGYSQSNVHLQHFPMTSGAVHSIVAGDQYTVLRGNFSIGTYQGNGAVLDAVTGVYDPAWPIFHGHVHEVISDNSGGWYVAGTSNVNEVLFQRLVHVKPDKTIDETWVPNPNNSVYALALDGNTLYVGGLFTQIAGTTRNRLAAFDMTTGNLLPWNPDMPGGRIDKLTVSGGIVYVGGQFTDVGGQSRKNIAAIDASTGVITSWNPTVDGINSSVQDIVVSGSIVYVSGFFTSAGGASRRSLAAIDATSGLATSWNPNPNAGVVRTMELAGSTMYIGGTFTLIGGIPREFLAEVSTSTGALTSWDPNFDDLMVYKVILSGTTLYVAGTFQTVNGLPKANLVAVSTITGALTSWDPIPGEWVTDMALFGTMLFVEAGDDSNFRFNWLPVNYEFSIIDNVSGEIFLNDLVIDQGDITSAITRGSTVYISGDFTTVNGEPRTGLAALDIPSGTVLPWAPETDGLVIALFANSSTVFLGGNFSQVNGFSRDALAAVDATTGDLLPLSHSFDGGQVFSLFATSTTLYMGGNFTSINGNSRNSIAAITINTGNLTSWNPTDPSLDEIKKIQANADWVVAHNSSNTIIALEAGSGNTKEGFLDINDFALRGNLLFLGTIQDVLGSNGIAASNLTTSNTLGWSPDVGTDPDGYPAIMAVGIGGNTIFVGGEFTSMGFEFRERFGGYSLIGLPNQAPVISSTVSAVPVEGVVTIDVLNLISDPDDNLDPASLKVVTPTSQQGASASINGSFQLVLDYGGVFFSGTDHVTIEVCDLSGECTQQVLTIEVAGDIVVYNAFSPNGDGKNEIFLLQYINLFPDTQQNRVSIYNRWGDEVFSISNYDNDTRVFKGISNSGKELTTGTYFYKIEFPSGRPVKTGFLSLKR